ncbi:hypothetical protein T06_9830, partial [Trichinella sp. T6]
MEHVIDPTRYSNFENLLQLNTFYLRFIHYAQAPPELRRQKKVDKACGKGDQGSLMMKVLWQFIPFLDEDGMMRFTGCLQRLSLPKKPTHQYSSRMTVATALKRHIRSIIAKCTPAGVKDQGSEPLLCDLLTFSSSSVRSKNEWPDGKLKLDDDQLKDYEKQVKPNNEDIEETGQDEQAMETDDEKSSNSVIENESELAVSESRQRSMLDEEKKAGEYVRNINADKVNEGVFEGSPDGNGQSSSRNEAQ